MVSHTIVTEIIFTLKGLARCSLKLRIYSPRRGWLISHASRRGELRKNAHAESSSKGVVGKTGTKIPTIPTANASTPIMGKKIFTLAKVINHAGIAIKPQKIVTFALK